MSYDYITRQDKELSLDESYFSSRTLYQLNAGDIYRKKSNITKMMNAVGVKENTNYTWFLYYFREHTVHSLLFSVGKILLEGLEFVSFESTMDKKTVFVTTDEKYFYFLTGHGKFKIDKEKSHCENFLLLELNDWKYLMELDFFSHKFRDLALEAENNLQLKKVVHK